MQDQDIAALLGTDTSSPGFADRVISLINATRWVDPAKRSAFSHDLTLLGRLAEKVDGTTGVILKGLISDHARAVRAMPMERPPLENTTRPHVNATGPVWGNGERGATLEVASSAT